MDLLKILVIAFRLAHICAQNNYLDKKFNEWTWLTSHNSHLNWVDSSVIYFASNQNLSLDDQLKFGVRGFMVDVDYKNCSYLEKILNSCNCEGNF